MKTRFLLVAAALPLLLTGCTHVGASANGAAPAGAHRQVVTVVRGSLTRTVVVPATVRAGARARVTAPTAGRYTVAGDRIGFRTEKGRAGLVRLPAGVRVVRSLVAAGQRVPRNYPVALAQVGGFALIAALDRSSTYKLYTPPTGAHGEITEGPGPFTCPLVDPVPTAAGTPPDGAGVMMLSCVVPQRLPVFEGQPGLMAITTGTVHDVLLVPLEAVAGSVESGSVWILDRAGNQHRRRVGLGLSDGAQIEVRSGLRLGDRVLVPGPDLAVGGDA